MNLDIDGFGMLLGQLVSTIQTYSGNDPARRMLFQEEDGGLLDNPHEEIVTWNVVERGPWTTSQGDQPGQGRRTSKAILVGEDDDALNPGYRLYTVARAYDNIVHICCWATDIGVSSKRNRWMEQLMDDWRWWFISNGIDTIRYEGQAHIEDSTKNGQRVVCRPLVYFVRTQKLSQIREKLVEDILISLNVETSNGNN
jgi:hypothetical protein